MLSVAESYMSLYEKSPKMVLYDKDLGSGQNPSTHVTLDPTLNPIEVVIESLINKVAESLSEKMLTGTSETAMVNLRFKEMAVKEIQDRVTQDKGFLKVMHNIWLRDFERSLSDLRKRNITGDEILFQLAMKFRISATGAAKAIRTVAG